jgi:hypothetical protein
MREQLLGLVYDPARVRLEGLDRAFNPFRILGVERYEIRHVNTLAWLLNPEESHGMGDRFLRLFLSQVCARNAALLEVVARSGLGSVRVRREVATEDLRSLADSEVDATLKGEDAEAPQQEEKPGALDLLLEADHWVVGVEAKMHAGAGDGQLSKYRDALSIGASGRPLSLIFLTKEDAVAPAEDGWSSAGWNEAVVMPMRIVLESVGGAASAQPHIAFIQSYLQVIEEQIASPESARERLLSELVSKYDGLLGALKWRRSVQLSADEKEVIRQHSSLLAELLRRYTPPNEARVEALKKIYEGFGVFKGVQSSVAYIRFIHRDWEGFEWLLEKGRDDLPGVVCELENNRDKGMKLKIMITDLIPQRPNRSEFVRFREHLLGSIQSDPHLRDYFPRAFKIDGSPRKPDAEYFGVRISNYVDLEGVPSLIQEARPSIDKLTELMAATDKAIRVQ